MSEMPRPTDDDLRARAIQRLQAKQAFLRHLTVYLLVNTLLIVVWAIGDDGFFWPVFPLLGWGIGLAFNAIAVYSPGTTEDRIQAEMRRMQGPKAP